MKRAMVGLRAVAVGLGVVLAFRAARISMAAQGLIDGPVGYWMVTFLSLAVAGWVVAKTHRGYERFAMSAFVIYAIAAKGWLVVSHFPVFWSAERPWELSLAVGLMGMGIACGVAGAKLGSGKVSV